MAELQNFYLGIDLNDKSAMISCYTPVMDEPETISPIAGSENFRIPLVLARKNDREGWFFGEEAMKMAMGSEVVCVDSLLERALAGEQIVMGQTTYEAKNLLALFLHYVMRLPEKLREAEDTCSKLVIVTERITPQQMALFLEILPLLGLTREQFLLMDHRSAFYYFALNQKESLWYHDVFLFECAGRNIRYLDLSRNTSLRPQPVTIHESRKYSFTDQQDGEFLQLLKNAFSNRVVSSVYLVGEGFGGGWMQKSLSFLCKGRRAFLGSNLYSKGACYAAATADSSRNWPFIYIGDNDTKFHLTLKIRDHQESGFYCLIRAGRSWYQEKGACEVILGDTGSIELWKQDPREKKATVEVMELEGLPARPPMTTRLSIKATPISDTKIDVEVTDLGFGELFRSSGKVWHYMVSG